MCSSDLRAVVAKAKELIPNKPIRYVITSHHHWDHLGGIRTAMDEGATIVTHQSNKAFLERVAKTPHTLVPDRLATSDAPDARLSCAASPARIYPFDDRWPVPRCILTGAVCRKKKVFPWMVSSPKRWRTPSLLSSSTWGTR